MYFMDICQLFDFFRKTIDKRGKVCYNQKHIKPIKFVGKAQIMIGHGFEDSKPQDTAQFSKALKATPHCSSNKVCEDL